MKILVRSKYRQSYEGFADKLYCLKDGVLAESSEADDWLERFMNRKRANTHAMLFTNSEQEVLLLINTVTVEEYEGCYNGEDFLGPITANFLFKSEGTEDTYFLLGLVKKLTSDFVRLTADMTKALYPDVKSQLCFFNCEKFMAALSGVLKPDNDINYGADKLIIFYAPNELSEKLIAEMENYFANMGIKGGADRIVSGTVTEERLAELLDGRTLIRKVKDSIVSVFNSITGKNK